MTRLTQDYSRIDNPYIDHPKVLAAGPLASYLNLAAILWSNRNTTDGFVPAAQVYRLVDWDGVAEVADGVTSNAGEAYVSANRVDAWRLARVLVDVDLWDETPDGFWIHDYLDYQRSAEQISALRAARQAAGKQGGRPTGTKAKANGKQTESKSEPIGQRTEDKEKSKLFSSDVEKSCCLLADLVEGNGTKRPNITTRWREAADRLLRIDGHDADHVEQVMRWALADQFWQSNILSMPKLREKFDQLALKMKAGDAGTALRAIPTRHAGDLSRFDRYGKEANAR